MRLQLCPALLLSKLDLWALFTELFPAAARLASAVAQVDVQTLAQERGRHPGTAGGTASA